MGVSTWRLSRSLNAKTPKMDTVGVRRQPRQSGESCDGGGADGAIGSTVAAAELFSFLLEEFATGKSPSGSDARPNGCGLAKANKVTFVFTPTNASWMNRIEREFTAREKFSLENCDYTSHEEQQAAIHSYLRWRNGQ